MPDVSAVLSLPYLLPAQAQKHVTHNEALARLDVAVQLAVIARDVTVPPGDAQTGDRYLVPAGATLDWAGHAGEVALMDQGAWVFAAPVAGWRATVLSEDRVLRFDGSAWQAGEGALEAQTLGVNAAADATNRLSVVAPATLLSHDGAGHQLKLNKAAPGDTASLLFQTGWSGRAELGTAGNDGFSLKVSADGSAWTTALEIDPASGLVSGAAVQASPGDTTAGKLARADHVYGPGNLLGPVSESGGTPTGAVIERGETPEGTYVRFADGTQICWSGLMSLDATTAAGALYRSAPGNWSFPRAFVAAPAVTPGRQDAAATHWTAPGSATATAAEVCAFAPVSTPGCAVSLVALGRWV